MDYQAQADEYARMFDKALSETNVKVKAPELDIGTMLGIAKNSLDVIGGVLDISNMIADAEIANNQRVFDAKQKNFDKWESQYQDELALKKAMGEETTQFEVDHLKESQEMKKSLAREESAMKAKAWQADKESKKSSAIMNGANAFISALSLPFPFNWIQSGLVGINTGVQVGLIEKQSMPSFAVGTANVPGDMTAQIHQGEAIIPKTFAESIRAGEMTLGSKRSGNTYNINGLFIGTNKAEIGKYLKELIDLADRKNN